MSPSHASRITLLLAVTATLVLSACGEDKRTLLSPEERPQELAFSLLRAEKPDNNTYTLRVRRDPSPAVDTFATIPRFVTAQLTRANDGTFWTVTQADTTAHVIRIDPAGGWTVRAARYKALRGVAVSSTGDLFLSADSSSAANTASVYRLAVDSTLTKLATGVRRVGQVALSPDESKLYVTNPSSNLILEITLSPLKVDTLRTDGTIVGPRALTFDDMGRLYVANRINTEIVRVDLTVPPGTAGHPVEVIATIPETKIGAMDWSNGTLWVMAGTRVYRLPDGGDIYNFVGSRVSGRVDADPGSLAEFVTPLGLVVDETAQILYVGDSGPTSAVRRVHLGQSQETGTWLPEYADRSVYRVIPTAWTFGLGSGERLEIPSSEMGAAVGSVAVGVAEDRLSVFGLRDHTVWVQLDIYRLL